AHVRLWDVSRGTPLAEAAVNGPDAHNTPGITGWHTGPGLADVRIAIAWSDQRFRVWDVARGMLPPVDDDENNNTAIAGRTPGEVLTGGYTRKGGAGIVTAWSNGNVGPIAHLPPDHRYDGPFYVPRDLAAFPSRPGGPIDRAAILARRQGER